MSNHITILEIGTRAAIAPLFVFVLILSGCASAGSVQEAFRLQSSGNVVKAEKMLLRLATSGDVAAQAHLGAMYAAGNGLERDYEKSFHWQHKAAKQGHTIAKYNIAILYAQGKGVAANKEQAVYWFAQAADAGMPHAQLHMGLMREKGWGISRCPYEASKWYYRAGQTFITRRNLKMARHAQQQIQRLLPDYNLAQQLNDEIFLAGGAK